MLVAVKDIGYPFLVFSFSESSDQEVSPSVSKGTCVVVRAMRCG